MTWTKVDDQLHSHPKIQHAWHADPVSLGLHLLALSHAGSYLTDGHVSESFVKTQVSSPARRRRAVGALVDAGLWEPVTGGWLIHDYLDFNESRDEVRARRAERSEQAAAAGRKGAAKRWPNGCSPNGEQIAPGRNGKRMAPSPTPVPYPT